jgi:hypothetical protein
MSEKHPATSYHGAHPLPAMVVDVPVPSAHPPPSPHPGLQQALDICFFKYNSMMA